MVETQMMTPAGELTLRRPHTAASSPLRAWSAADELALHDLGDSTSDALGRVLIVNDEFGAIACGLAAAEPWIWTDSALSRRAIESNLATNGLASATERFVTGSEQPTGPFDTVVVRVPKTTALLDYQLAVVASVAAPGARVVGTGMTRHIHRSTVSAFEKLIGATTTSLAVRKARLIRSEAETAGPPVTLQPSYFGAADGLQVAELPGTFSDGRVDAGSALLLEHLSQVPVIAGSTIVDLGCGNGVLAASLAGEHTNSAFHLFDVSDMAVTAARHTWAANELEASADFVVADGLVGLSDGSVDLVMTNPPFHQGHALDAALADRLLADAARALKPGGTAAVVAQRDLNLHTKMKRWFSDVEVVSKNPTYVVLLAQP